MKHGWILAAGWLALTCGVASADKPNAEQRARAARVEAPSPKPARERRDRSDEIRKILAKELPDPCKWALMAPILPLDESRRRDALDRTFFAQWREGMSVLERYDLGGFKLIVHSSPGQIRIYYCRCLEDGAMEAWLVAADPVYRKLYASDDGRECER